MKIFIIHMKKKADFVRNDNRYFNFTHTIMPQENRVSIKTLFRWNRSLHILKKTS